MKLDRNINEDGRGKYALVLMRKLAEARRVHSPQGVMEIQHAIKVLEVAGIIDWGNTVDSEFFVIRLKDRFAAMALHAYAAVASNHDAEYGSEIREMASRAGPMHPNCKRPD